ncbi:GDSL-type esterase/lipase family protein [Hydrocarboniphaga sp.]|uniref:GDSL-type esterase/lipase family protein n=1 Tax=Hydrocarboniphaga sp. TaxID=2033016 RepID=UPI003D0D34CE
MSDSKNPVSAIGMVDRLDTPASGFRPAEIEFVKAYLASGPMDAKITGRLGGEELLKARDAAQAELRQRDWPNLGQYRDANAALAGRSVEAVFIGDSITEFWGYADTALFSGKVHNRGISGQTTPQMLLRFMADVIRLRPTVVHLMGGTNDIAGNTGPSTYADYQNNLLAMIALARHHGLRVILGSLVPAGSLGWRPEVQPRPRIAQINAWLRELAAEHGLVYADYHAVLSTPDGAMRADYTRDGVHPTAAGYAAMRPVALAALDQALK